MGSFGLLGRAEVGAGVDSPEGCYTITVRRHGLVCHGRVRGAEGTQPGGVASKNGGLVLGADRSSVAVPLVQEPGGASQGVHVWVHLQRVHC